MKLSIEKNSHPENSAMKKLEFHSGAQIITKNSQLRGKTNWEEMNSVHDCQLFN